MLSTTSAQSMCKVGVAFILSISRQGILYMRRLVRLNKVLGFNGFIYAQPITDMVMLVFSSILLFNVIQKDNKLENYTLKE